MVIPPRIPLHIGWRVVISLMFLAATPIALGQTEPNLRIVTLGDSITKGQRAGVEADQTFASLLESDLRRSAIQVEVINVGIGGERTDQAVTRLQEAVIDRFPHLVTVMYGTNDSYVDAGSTSSRISETDYRENLQEIVRRLRDARIQVVLMTAPAWGEESRPNGLGENPNLRLAPYMEACREVARDSDVPLVDHFAHWMAQQKRGTKIQDWTTDGCHPNPRGHAEIARRIFHTILPSMQRLADREHAWDPDTEFRIQLDTLSQGYDGRRCWVHPRAGTLGELPGDGSEAPRVVLTMQYLLLTGSDVFYPLHDIRTDDGGATWSAPREHADALGRRDEPGGVIVAACDFTPQWHAASQKQHWVTHQDRLYLVYTRRGFQNDHVFRHRAPLFIAEVDPEQLCLRRETERVLVPERGARLGNFGVVQVSPEETWVTTAEWMQPWSPEVVIRPDNPCGADNRVYAARIRWSSPSHHE